MLSRPWMQKAVSRDFFGEDGNFLKYGVVLILWNSHLWFWNFLLSTSRKANCRWNIFKRFTTKFATEIFFFFINYANLATYIPRVLLTQFKANNYFTEQHACRGLKMISQYRREKNARKRNTLKYAKYFQMPFNFFFFTRIQLNTLGMPV